MKLVNRLCLLLLLVSYVCCTEVYVSSIRGNDTIGSGTLDNPFQTLDRVGKFINDNSNSSTHWLVLVEAGNYNTTLFSVNLNVSQIGFEGVQYGQRLAPSIYLFEFKGTRTQTLTLKNIEFAFLQARTLSSININSSLVTEFLFINSVSAIGISNSTFNNLSTAYLTSGSLVVSDSNFAGTQSARWTADSIMIDSCTFTNQSTLSLTVSFLELRSSVFYQNLGFAGAILLQLEGGSFVVDSCAFIENGMSSSFIAPSQLAPAISSSNFFLNILGTIQNTYFSCNYAGSLYPPPTFLSSQVSIVNSTFDRSCLAYCPSGQSFDVNALVCKECAAGNFRNQTLSPYQCEPCAAGSISPLPGAPDCLPCSAGFFAAQPGQVSCKICPTTTYQPLTGQSECISCPSNSISDIPPIKCTACNSNEKPSSDGYICELDLWGSFKYVFIGIGAAVFGVLILTAGGCFWYKMSRRHDYYRIQT